MIAYKPVKMDNRSIMIDNKPFMINNKPFSVLDLITLHL